MNRYERLETLLSDSNDKTFEYEMNILSKNSLTGRTCIPMDHIRELWAQSTMLARELDQLNAMGTNISSLSNAVIKIRMLIFLIPEQLNIEHKKKEAEHDHYDGT